ncbi:MAG: hypothetical protein ACLVG9_01090 [Eubacteriales bacterium]
MMKTILCIGEALIDFIPAQKGCALKDNTQCSGGPAAVRRQTWRRQRRPGRLQK